MFSGLRKQLRRLSIRLTLWHALLFLAAALTGLLIDRLIYQPLERRGALRTTLFIASLGLLILVENLVAMVAGSVSTAWPG